MKTNMLMAVMTLLLANIAWAADQEKKLETKAKETVSAASIDFATALQLPFDSLALLGARIEQARKSADPVGLASAAVELAAAEKASDKSASLKSEALKKEALELAKLRADQIELKAVQSLLGENLEKEIKLAAKRQEEAAAAAKDGEQSKGIFHELVVDNHSEVYVNIYVNGQYVGQLRPYGHGHFHVHTHHETVLDARGYGHSWHEHVQQDYNTYYWTLQD